MSKDTKTPAPITDDERRKRQKAVDFARASVGLEGFKLSPECDALAVRYVNGEIEISEVIEGINEQAQRLPR
ncbi:hypothetical protein BDD18_4354 [Acidovorax temperans]|uniref:Antitoxin VbhA domain-containing protein n=1 Tax=Acidovorax temperans TaxID=80878 RepID=A0A543KTS1_9BURK|nr:antitoxin VbhA family protein [Acidovorax temperans]TQM98466.1 hypothetical protein BDD18_4354 [Acidovorax temperans]